MKSSKNNKKRGGDTNVENVPNGGFPPIYLCKKGEDKPRDYNKEFVKANNSAGIADLLNNKKKRPLFSL